MCNFTELAHEPKSIRHMDQNIKDSWNSRKMTHRTIRKWQHYGIDMWTNRHKICGSMRKWHLDHWQKDMWVNRERTRGKMWKRHVAAYENVTWTCLISPRGFILACPVAVLFAARGASVDYATWSASMSWVGHLTVLMARLMTCQREYGHVDLHIMWCFCDASQNKKVSW